MTELTELASRARTVRSQLDSRAGEARMLEARVAALEAEVAQQSQNRETAERVSGVLSKLGSDRDQAAREQVEALVSSGLAAVFGDSEQLSFHLVQETKNKTSNVSFIVRTHVPQSDGTIQTFDTDILSARGGGLAAVVGLLLRVVLVILTKQTHPERAPEILVVDESLAMLSREYLPAAAAFLRTLVDKTDLQIIMVTHQEELAEEADKIYRFSLDSSGVTKVKTVK